MTRRRIAGITAGALAALAGLYGIAWVQIADRLARGIDRWAAERRAEGWVAAYDTIAVSGFPFAWRAHLTAPRLARRTPAPAFLWSGPSLDLAWQPWNARAVGFRSAGSHRLGLGPAYAGSPARLDVAAARGRMEFDAGGRLQRLTLLVDDATVLPPAGDGVRVNRLVATVDAAPEKTGAAAGDAHRTPSLRVDGELFGLTLPAEPRPALGRTIGHIALRAAIMGTLPAADPAGALDRWRENGGTVEIERLALGWSALVVRADGTLALDARLQPVGALTARISGYGETADALVAAGLVKPGQALVAKIALGALARTPQDGGRPEIEAPLAAQEGWLFVGPVRLLPLPRVRWE